MNRIKQEPIRFVKIFSVLYLILNVAASVIYYAVASKIYFYYDVVRIEVRTIISWVPILLFIIYVFGFFGVNKTKILLSLSYGVSVLLGADNLIRNIRAVRFYSRNLSIPGLRNLAINSLLDCLFGAICLAFAIFFLITCLSDFKYIKTAKKIVLINAAISVFSILLSIILHLFRYRFHFFSIIQIFDVMPSCISLTAILSHIAYIVFWLYAVDKRNAPSLEYDLVSLKKKFDNGEITESEYDLGKAKILNNL